MITTEAVKKFVTDETHGLLKISSSILYHPLKVLKYSKKVFFKDLWNPILMEMRGTVLDEEYNPLILPFRKTFNRNENPGYDFQDDEYVLAVRKINGFMASVTYLPEFGQPVICTTGSLDSVFTEYARQIIPMEAMLEITRQGMEARAQDQPQWTHVFEIVHPEDPHVIPEQIGAYYLGRRLASWHTADLNFQTEMHQKTYDTMALVMCVQRPEWFTSTWKDICNSMEKVIHEGFMCWDINPLVNKSVKLKSPYYSIVKFFGRTNSIISIPSHIDGELAQQVKQHVLNNVVQYVHMDEQEKFKFIWSFLNEQKIYN